MRKYLLLTSFSNDRGSGVTEAKEKFVIEKTFSQGPAWATRNAVLFESTKSSPEILSELSSEVVYEDLLILLDREAGTVHYWGLLFDEEGFFQQFPQAIEYIPSPPTT